MHKNGKTPALKQEIRRFWHPKNPPAVDFYDFQATKASSSMKNTAKVIALV